MKNREKIKKLILEDLRTAPVIQLSCDRAGVSRATFYRMKKSDKKFAQAADEALLEGRMTINDLAESRLMAAIQSGNLTSVMYWLNHNHSQYSNKLEIKGELTTKHELSEAQEADIKRALSLIKLKEASDGE
ncbi:MAG: hypothetical protein M1355_04405 [Patescibacteria group bacterium]|nr:hypothetical protein [Patescibacteria group bacterium]